MASVVLRRGGAVFARPFQPTHMATRSLQSVATLSSSTPQVESILLSAAASAPQRPLATKRTAQEVRASAALMAAVNPLAFSSPVFGPSSVPAADAELPSAVGYREMVEESGSPVTSMDLMNRNHRDPKPANHGKRPCSNRRRKRIARHRANEHLYMPCKLPKGCDK
jgi:hypothetical protein